MSIVRSIILAVSCFSIVPCPQVEWDESNMRYMMCAFPLVGVVIGLVLWAWWAACDAIGFGSLVRGVGITLLPIIVSGGIHMDGFADIVDAQASHASAQRKREILSDPHTGSLAIVGVGCYVVAYFAFACEVDARMVPLLCCAPVISRILSGWATTAFSVPVDEGMYYVEHASAQTAQVRIVLGAFFAVACALAICWGGVAGVAAVVTSIAALGAVRVFAYTQFEGMTGDMAGFFLQVAELVMLIVVVSVGKVM